MRISVAEAEGQLTELVRLANQGEEVVLTQDGLVSVRLEPIDHVSDTTMAASLSELRKPLKLASETKPLSPTERRRLVDEIRKGAPAKGPLSQPDAARSQDFLYDENGLPG